MFLGLNHLTCPCQPEDLTCRSLYCGIVPGLTTLLYYHFHGRSSHQLYLSGSVEFGISSAGDRLKQWFNCLKHADEQFDSWHILPSNDTLKKSKGKS